MANNVPNDAEKVELNSNSNKKTSNDLKSLAKNKNLSIVSNLEES